MFKNNISHSLMVLAIILIGCGESPETKLHTLFNNVWEEELKESEQKQQSNTLADLDEDTLAEYEV